MTHQFPRGSFDFRSHVYIVDGVNRAISGNVASLLRLLVLNRDRVVSHTEIGTALAEGDAYVRTYVSTHVNRLRDALGDGAFIRTVPREGYQWVDDPSVGPLAAIDRTPGRESRLLSTPDKLSEGPTYASLGASSLQAITPSESTPPDAAAVSVSLPVLGQLLVLGAPGLVLREVATTPIQLAVAAATFVLLAASVLLLRDRDSGPQLLARSLANALTFSRPAFGAAGAFEMASSDSEMGLWWYFAGLASDVADGAVARVARVESAAGRDWDAMSDAFMNGAFGLGLGAVALRSPAGLQQLLLLSSLVLVFAMTRSQAHTILDKCLSGIWRVALFTMGLVSLNSSARGSLVIAGISGAIVACAYESLVLWGDLRHGRRPLARVRGRVALLRRGS
ncbi:MAG: winged helix-turn-helix domain-containing protein [Gemmatimonadaceae bacterium]